MDSATRPALANSERQDAVRAAFLRGGQTYGELGSRLYAALFTAAADDPALVELASHAQPGAQPAFHLVACVHFLLLGDRGDRLAEFYPTIALEPAPPEEAFPHFQRYCAAHREQLLHLMATRTVQTTYVERCGILAPLIAVVAEAAGEPLNLVEVGCSAGILLAFDNFAYALPDGRIVGAAGALTVPCAVHGGPELRIPAIGTRAGIDLHPIDVRSADERRWLVALSIPELHAERERLLQALDVVAATDIRLLGGDGLELVPKVLAETPGPVCIYHSACLSYWPEAARAAFDGALAEASRERDIYRVGVEAAADVQAWHRGQPDSSAGALTTELTLARYRQGQAESAVVARGPIFGPFEWIKSPAWAEGRSRP